ncbi:hypothetical protein MKZ38_007032 [Zalerion maritima]|uniref:Proteasome assembly chaperone 3 n=1 Tax=Zalerion maritima TaxID=339359 RepID=A0AAD5RX16_9PEZI|nr:hypothetical protein MKZ38_007032 [Zalerion maritima]
METPYTLDDPFPVRNKQAASTINGIPTDASCMHFSDKILVTISQDGALSQWIQVPLSAPSSAQLEGQMLTAGTRGMLPMAHLTPSTMLGSRGTDRETLGHGIATQLASRLTMMNSEDRRTVVVGLGLKPGEFDRNLFFDIMELAFGVL